MQWRIPREWEGETAFILGGGASLDLVDIAALRRRGRVIAVNDAGLVRAPWADVHYWADTKWFDWNRKELGLFQGQYRITRQEGLPETAFDIKQIRRDKIAPLSCDPSAVAGYCSGANAINIAFLFGSARIILFGFDMKPGRWHDRHKKPSKPAVYQQYFIPALTRMASALKAGGVEVINATPGSALGCFPIVHPDEVPA